MTKRNKDDSRTIKTPPEGTVRRTKIVCTLGPACASQATLERMIEAGMDVARFNFSHGDHQGHAAMLALLRRASRRVGRPVGVLQDLCGPKIRVGKLPEAGIELRDGAVVELRVGSHAVGSRPGKAGTLPEVPVEYAGLAREVRPGMRLLFDDGALEARAEAVGSSRVRVRFLRGGVLKSRKGLNLPDSEIRAASVTRKDLRDLEWGLRHGVDFVALSFVRRAEDLLPVRRRLARVRHPPLLISKIERPEAVRDLERIVAASDGVMVARGDLGVELDFAEVPLIQKRLIELANRLDIPVVTATQMLESMRESSRPTRAEVSDVANAILDGTDAVMLSGETASGRFPVEAVEAMARIADEADGYCNGRRAGYQAQAEARLASCLHDALALGAEQASRVLQVRALVVATRTGKTARFVASARPGVPVLGLSAEPAAVGRMTLLRGVRPIQTRDFGGKEGLLRKCEEAARANGLAKAGEMIVIVAGTELSTPFSGSIQLHRVR